MTTAFWNVTHRRERERNADPLGFDALREAMADVLAPCLTGGTSHADDFLWVLVGLRWARDAQGAVVDVDVSQQFFKFERGLKQYWQKYTKRRGYLGTRAVVELCRLGRPDVTVPILTDERASGLLGTYVASLRTIGLIEKSSLAPTSKGGDLIRGVSFDATARTFTSWKGLLAGYQYAEGEVQARRQGLGRALFADDSMHRVGAAVRAQPTARSWRTLAARLSAEQQHIAAACDNVLAAEEAMVGGFALLLEGSPKLPPQHRAQIKSTCTALGRRRPLPRVWSSQPIAQALDAAWQACRRAGRIEKSLVELHRRVVHEVRGNDPWITMLGDEAQLDFRFQPSGRDFRLANLQRLVKETRWQP